MSSEAPPSSTTTTAAWKPNVADADFDRAWRIAVLLVIMIIGVLGGCMVCIWLRFNWSRKSRVFHVIYNVTLSDLLVMFVACFMQLIWEIMNREWLLGNICCKLLKMLQAFTLATSNFMVVVLSLDRLQAVVYPLKPKISAKKLTNLGWLLGFLVSTPQCLVFHEAHVNVTSPFFNKTVCESVFRHLPIVYRQMYITIIGVLTFYIPFLIILVSYVVIYVEILKQSRKFSVKPSSCAEFLLNMKELNSRCKSGRNKNFATLSYSVDNNDEMTATTTITSSITSNNINSTACNSINTINNININNISNENSSIKNMNLVTMKDTKNKTFKFWPTKSTTVHNCSSNNVQKISVCSKSGYASFERAKIKTIKMAIVISSCFLLCVSPYHLIETYMSFSDHTHLSKTFYSIVGAFAVLNSAINPYVFLFFNVGGDNDHLCNCFKEKEGSMGLKRQSSGGRLQSVGVQRSPNVVARSCLKVKKGSDASAKVVTLVPSVENW